MEKYLKSTQCRMIEEQLHLKWPTVQIKRVKKHINVDIGDYRQCTMQPPSTAVENLADN